MKNSIAERVNDFLKNYPPFNLLKNEDLLKISTQVSIIYLEKGDTLFKKGDSFNHHFYMVRNGGIALLHTTPNNIQEIINISDAGDVFGVKLLLLKKIID
ncbi:cyclic nucleotide-binding domain-containing protein [Thalassobellus suaedae]|uniref:Cyclic nucleotide-binding domain-containing protein n=1 Tax=Thalassobellus suaedae TaxID=3074124 RepID=A0ABY9XV29_9FLAO|nr:cyclic nucleotide-binding domain-containing protein [Flavobacteriaceae bacterium HL-DH14]